MNVHDIYTNAADEARRAESERRSKIDVLIKQIETNEKTLADSVTEIHNQQQVLHNRLCSAYENFLDMTNHVRTELMMLRGDHEGPKVLKLEGGKKKDG